MCVDACCVPLGVVALICDLFLGGVTGHVCLPEHRGGVLRYRRPWLDRCRSRSAARGWQVGSTSQSPRCVATLAPDSLLIAQICCIVAHGFVDGMHQLQRCLMQYPVIIDCRAVQAYAWTSARWRSAWSVSQTWRKPLQRPGRDRTVRPCGPGQHHQCCATGSARGSRTNPPRCMPTLQKLDVQICCCLLLVAGDACAGSQALACART